MPGSKERVKTQRIIDCHGVVETQWIDVIPEPPARARRNRRHRRAPLWAPEAVGHVTRRGRGEVGRLVERWRR
jgi:hypothetical protein